jgi:ATP-dependent protease HslVU (ClpYQ) peptidase subunit
MTCIIGVLDKENDCVYIGADSMGSSSWRKAIYKNKKVFKAKDNKNVLMAICGAYKLQNFLSIEENMVEELKELKNEVNFEHMVKYVSPKIMNLSKTYGCCEIKDGRSYLCGDLIFAYKNQMYFIQEDGSILEPEDDYIASGSGGEHSMAVLSQNGNKDIITRITEGLESAEKHAIGVQRPFYIMNTLNDEIIEIR